MGDMQGGIDAAAFVLLALELRSPTQVSIALDAPDGRPALRHVRELRLELGGGAVRFQTGAGGAVLVGDASGRARVADEVETFMVHNDLSEPGVHTHVAMPGGLDLVLAGVVPDEPLSS